MLIDDSSNANSIQNVSYLIPIGICLYLIIATTKRIAQDAFFEWGVHLDTDVYLNYWTSHSVSLVLVVFLGYIFVRSIWRKISSGEFNCSRLFVSLLIIAIVFMGLSFMWSYVLSIFEEARSGTSEMTTEEYVDFIVAISPYTWGVEFVMMVLSITFATQVSDKIRHEEA